MSDLSDFLRDLPPLRAERKPRQRKVVSTPWKDRYEQAYQRNHREQYPDAYRDHGYPKTTFPAVETSNGLQQAIIKYLLWNGHNADRTGNEGRMRKIKGQYIRIASASRKGKSDVSATVAGRSVKLEAKVGRDIPSPEQLREQELERKAGGIYEFVHSMEEFFVWYDQFLLPLT